MPVRIDIWIDVVCPFCYLGKRRFERALAASGRAGDIILHRRSFVLLPSAPSVDERSMVEHLIEQHAITKKQATASMASLAAEGSEERIDLRFPRAPGNTFDAHRLLKLAAQSGLDGVLEDRLFEAFFTAGIATGDLDALMQIAVQAGLDGPSVRLVLDGDGFADAVRNDIDEARRRRIGGRALLPIRR